MRLLKWLRRKWELNQKETRREYNEFANGKSRFFKAGDSK